MFNNDWILFPNKRQILGGGGGGWGGGGQAMRSTIQVSMCART